jgi:hypothetical protein
LFVSTLMLLSLSRVSSTNLALAVRAPAKRLVVHNEQGTYLRLPQEGRGEAFPDHDHDLPCHTMAELASDERLVLPVHRVPLLDRVLAERQL